MKIRMSEVKSIGKYRSITGFSVQKQKWISLGHFSETGFCKLHNLLRSRHH